MSDFLSNLFTLAFFSQILRITVPYAMAALGGVMSERSGVINIALEGILLVGAFGGAVGAYEFDSVTAGMLAGCLGGVLVAALYAFVVVTMKADQIVSGVAINLFALGITSYLLKPLYGSTSNSPDTPGFDAHILSNPFFWMLVAIGVLVYYLITRTKWGLRIRAVGDHPEAAHTLGIRVNAIRWRAVLTSGALAGLGGAWLALGQSSFSADMSGGRGYIALAAVIMGGWRPHWACAACLLFGFADAVQTQLQISNIGFPVELTQTFPWVLTMVVLAGFIGRSRPPKALGQPFDAD